MMTANTRMYMNGMIRLCLDGKEGNDLYGRLYTPYEREGRKFSDLGDMLMCLESVLEYRGFPQTTFEYRDFRRKGKTNRSCNEKPAVVRSPESIKRETGLLDTVTLYVTSRQNGTVQGRITFQSTGNMYQYDSDLNLLQMIEQKAGKNTEVFHQEVSSY